MRDTYFTRGFLRVRFACDTCDHLSIFGCGKPDGKRTERWWEIECWYYCLDDGWTRDKKGRDLCRACSEGG